MSATNRGAERVPNDFYVTPGWCVRALGRAVPYMTQAGLEYCDPAAGDGAILKELVGGTAAVEIRDEMLQSLSRACDTALIADALGDDERVVDLRSDRLLTVVTNPPFSLAKDFIEKWAGGRRAAFLLRLNFLGGQGMADWWQRWRPAQIHVLPRRPVFVAVCRGLSKTKTRQQVKGCGKSFPAGTRGKCDCGGTIGDGTDATEYAWFLWGVPAEPLSVVPLEYCK